MAALPQIPSELPDGFLYSPEFISSEEENELLRQIANLEFRAFDFHGYIAKRRIVEYGFEYDFTSREPAPRAAAAGRHVHLAPGADGVPYQHFSMRSGYEPRHGPEFVLTRSSNRSSPNTHPALRLGGIATFHSSKSSSEFR